jgi:cytochrome c oxidase assembly protein subunit 15
MTSHKFRTFGLITVFTVYFLILVGGIVRSTGSGMGCPDWPKCFGYWIPPTDISQLPDNYKEIFAVAGKQIADFDAFKTWTEYVNRLIGVLTGFFIFLAMIFSFEYRKSDKIVPILTVLSFVLVAFEGWLGSVVVATHLKPVTITLHMLLALVIVCLLIFAVARVYGREKAVEANVETKKISFWLLTALVLNLAQIALGTQVREAVDEIALRLGENMRGEWTEHLGLAFWIHRSFSLVILATQVYGVVLVKKHFGKQFSAESNVLIVLLVSEILSGAAMANLGFPAFLQPFHLLAGSLLIGGQFTLLMFFNKKLLLAGASEK